MKNPFGKDQNEESENPEGEEESGIEEVEAKGKKELSGAPKIAVAGLGVLIMVLGVGFVLMQMVSGGGKNQRQQMLSQQARQQQIQQQAQPQSGQDQRVNQQAAQQTDQQSRDLQAMIDENRQSEQDKAAQQPAGRNSSQANVSGQPAGDKKKHLRKPLADPASATTTAAPPGGDLVQPEPKQSKVAAKAVKGKMDKILEKLATIEENMENRMDTVSENVESLKYGIETNGDRIGELAGKVEKVSGATAGVKPEKYTALMERKNELEKKVVNLEKEVEDLEGKYKWVRHLESKKSKKLKDAKQELEQARKEIKKLAHRPVFGEWQLAGLSTDEMLLVNPYNGQVKRLQAGESFQGVTVEQIDAKNGKVQTNAGIMELG